MPRGEASRQQPWWVPPHQERWANEWVVSQHTEALWLVGEPALFTMMWRVQHYEAGLVDKCPVCQIDNRAAEAWQQSDNRKCPSCYGTTYEGGIRAQVVRPAIFGDRNSERIDTQRGTVDRDSMQVETTEDFVFHKGDYVFRRDNSRYQGEEKGEGVLRTGYSHPLRNDSFRGTIPQVYLEEETAIAHLLPPTPGELAEILAGPPRVEDLSGTDVLAGAMAGVSEFGGDPSAEDDIEIEDGGGP